MGIYLSKPVTTKCIESGESLECPITPVAWGVVDMQGWRNSMEDAHVAVTDIPVPRNDQDEGGESGTDGKVFGVFDGHGGPEVARFCQLYLVSVLTQQPTWREESPTDSTERNPAKTGIGEALVAAFHALDRMINDASRRDEISKLRSTKPEPGEQRQAQIFIPTLLVDTVEGSLNENPSDEQSADAFANNTPDGNKPGKTQPSSEDDNPDDETEDNDVGKAQEGREDQGEDEGEAGEQDSLQVQGTEEAAERDRDMMDSNDEISEESPEASDNDETNDSKVTVMFKKVLNFGGQAGQMVIKVGEEEQEKGNTAKPPAPAVTPVPATRAGGPSASQPTVIQNGQMVCNLPDHPIHAGATAIVAVIVGRTLTVANAGDSRAVLCRGGGKVLPLSFDHKPQQTRELNRIHKAGGFVNQYGRVNGNLNLSRSIGDLKYKQVPGIQPSEQIITAEPDILQLTLHPKDEFMILGCDGIWDCLTNEQAVEFVRQRIDTLSPTEIGAAMLDKIISADPRLTQGIGGDNMTVMIVDLQPASRKQTETEGV